MKILFILAILLIIFIILDARTSRPDGEYLKQTHPYRKLMPHVMKTRNESIVYLDLDIPADNLLQFVQEHEKIGMTQCVVGAVGQAIQRNPEVNRFTVGGRLYQRNKIILSFSMKRKKLSASSKIAVVSQVFTENMEFSQLCDEIEKKVSVERTDEKTYADKEYSLLNSFPRFLLRFGVWFVRKLDDFNLLPASFIDNDGLYCSAFIANLGSLNMEPGFHHLYEWGNCPIFVTSGAVVEKIMAENGQPVVKKVLPLKMAFDERVNDGLGVREAINYLKQVLENPQEHLQLD